MESIAGSTRISCASGTLGMKFGMVDFANLTIKLSGGEAVRLNELLGACRKSLRVQIVMSAKAQVLAAPKTCMDHEAKIGNAIGTSARRLCSTSLDCRQRA